MANNLDERPAPQNLPTIAAIDNSSTGIKTKFDKFGDEIKKLETTVNSSMPQITTGFTSLSPR
ncbi:hypothetical protein BPOR_1130g00030 [Botrytis porri]|uniref:Uncharacterized protein n=1 Tax=Botrytis porri TaxID=87229 RepID=A0A4Z1KJ47_9HELO|nr:hypothetical protein BPOR_1130g00030 [Botrytis porri]